MEVCAKGVGNGLLRDAVRRIDDDAVGVSAVFCNAACASDLTFGNCLAVVGERLAVQPVVRRIGNCRILSRFIQVPDADVVAPRFVVRDVHAVCDVVAHVELGALLHRRELDPHEHLTGGSNGFIDIPSVFVDFKAGAVFRKEGQVITESFSIPVCRGHVRKAESGNARLRHANEHGEVLEHLASRIAVDHQLDLVVEIGHR